MALPLSVATRTVVGTFLDLEGTPIVGAEIQFRPSPARLLVPGTPVTLLPGRVTTTTDAAGQISVDLVVTDDADVSPTGWTWSVVIDIPRTQWAAQPYGFAFELPAGADPVDLTTVTPVPAAGGTPIVTGPPGPDGPAGPPGPPGTGGGILTGGVDDGVPYIDVPFTPWGIDELGVPYFDAEGAAPGEEALLQFDPTTGAPVLITIGGA